MAVLEIKKIGDPVLRKKSQAVKEIDKEIVDLARDMAEIMKKNSGIGLAAPQVGINKRIIAVKSGKNSSDVLVLINPKIFSKSKEKEIGQEGCLSMPGVFLDIKRTKRVEVSGQDIEGKEIKISADGLLSRVFQHEIDHLDGVLFFDRLPLWERIKFKWKFKI